jgi:hypothetical protein
MIKNRVDKNPRDTYGLKKQQINMRQVFFTIVICITSLTCYGQTTATYDTVKFTIEKYCESIYELVDAGAKPPRPKRIFKYKAIKLKPSQLSDSVVLYTQNIKGLLVDITIRTGIIKISKPSSYYIGHDSDKLPQYAQGVKNLDVKVGKKVIPIEFDHILNVDPKSLMVLKDITSPKIFLFLSNGDGAGSDYSLWIIYNNKVMGHYAWEYGYDEWSPRNNLDAFPMKEPFDKCTVYKISGL